MDELRDYRWYSEDLIHPSKAAQDYILNRFGQCYFSVETEKINREIDKVRRNIAHQPIIAKSLMYKNHIEKTLSATELLSTKYNYLNFFDEQQYCRNQLSLFSDHNYQPST